MVKLKKQSSSDMFTFCSPVSVENTSNDIFDETEIREWAQTMEGFGQETHQSGDLESLSLWKKARPVFGYALYPPSSQAQEIARHRKQMLDLIQDVPEPAYELSLKDLAELPKLARCKQNEIDPCIKDFPKKKKEGKNSNDTSTGAFILKMLVPPSPGRRSFVRSSGSSKVSPKPQTNHERKNETTSRSSSSSSNSSSTERSVDISTEDSTSSSKKKKQGCFPSFERKPSQHHKYLT